VGLGSFLPEIPQESLWTQIFLCRGVVTANSYSVSVLDVELFRSLSSESLSRNRKRKAYSCPLPILSRLCHPPAALQVSCLPEDPTSDFSAIVIVSLFLLTGLSF
jgi:hypothetical protein